MPTEERDLLLYTVLGELYASPLADLHTVVDLDWASVADVTDTIEVQNHQVRMVTMEHVFGEAPPLVTGKANRPMLVVSVESRWVGLVIDDVHGMVETPRITPLPGGLSEFPEELILGAFERPHPAKEHDAEHEEPGDADESTDRKSVV